MSPSADSAPREFVNGAQYFLPKDAPEHKRLDVQSKGLLYIMGNQPFRAPVSKPKKILDIGSGTGTMTQLLAKIYPEAQVIGIDLAPVPEHIHGHLPNVTYIQGDISKLAGHDSDLEFGSFDYVFERLLFLGMRNWPEHVALLTKLVRSGGWLEMQEGDMNMKSPSNETIGDRQAWMRKVLDDSEAQGMDFEAGRHLKMWLDNVSDIENVKAERFSFPAGKTPAGETEGMEALDEWMDAFPSIFELFIPKCCAPMRGKDEANEMVKASQRDWYAGYEKGTHFDIWAAYGQKR